MPINIYTSFSEIDQLKEFYIPVQVFPGGQLRSS